MGAGSVNDGGCRSTRCGAFEVDRDLVAEDLSGVDVVHHLGAATPIGGGNRHRPHFGQQLPCDMIIRNPDPHGAPRVVANPIGKNDRRLHYQCQWAWPVQSRDLTRRPFDHPHLLGLVDGGHQQSKGLAFRPAFHLIETGNGLLIERIDPYPVDGVRRHADHEAGSNRLNGGFEAHGLTATTYRSLPLMS